MSKYRTFWIILLVIAALTLMVACSEDSAPQPGELPTDTRAETPAAGVAEASTKDEESVPVAAPQAKEAAPTLESVAGQPQEDGVHQVGEMTLTSGDAGLFRARGYSPYAGRKFPTRVYWGDTHLHTSNSLDARAFGVTLGPEEACIPGCESHFADLVHALRKAAAFVR